LVLRLSSSEQFAHIRDKVLSVPDVEDEEDAVAEVACSIKYL
jgi:hypothetical protein